MIQVALGTVPLERCALSVLATVISTPTTDRAILDSGSKTLSSDKGGHGNENVKGHGFILDKDTHLSKLSEEHGIVLHDEEIIFTVGEKIRIIPNHACTTVNNFDYAYIVDGEEIVDVIEISARGCIY
jgi:D-serine deaminase-like pyridoxal phosphate-dependent protein